jgi:hypothetical protein
VARDRMAQRLERNRFILNLDFSLSICSLA